jgi:hypothetical protein
MESHDLEIVAVFHEQISSEVFDARPELNRLLPCSS